MTERLQKFLARAGIASRRKAEILIKNGRVTVNGQTAELGMSVSEEDTVAVDGERIKKQSKAVTYMLNKPAGYVSTVSDEKGRPTVMELVPRVAGLHPVGRLDLPSEGLLLFSTDGDLTEQMTHPRYEHEKEYRVWCRQGALEAGALATLEQGIILEDGPAKARVAKRAEGGCKLVITEGRKHQVRRMVAAVGCSVTRLVRTRIERLELGDLATGNYRKLSAADIKRLGYTRKGEG